MRPFQLQQGRTFGRVELMPTFCNPYQARYNDGLLWRQLQPFKPGLSGAAVRKINLD
jgi:hypothetical protein